MHSHIEEPESMIILIISLNLLPYKVNLIFEKGFYSFYSSSKQILPKADIIHHA
jgi:hypothetical protein